MNPDQRQNRTGNGAVLPQGGCNTSASADIPLRSEVSPGPERCSECGWPIPTGECGRCLNDMVVELRGTPADAHDFAIECSQEWGLRVAVRVDERRTKLPPSYRPDHDGPTWVIRPKVDPPRPVPPQTRRTRDIRSGDLR